MTIDGETIERMVAWRRDLHAHPELAFAETRTAELVARELAALGLSVRTGIGRTGVVGTLQRGDGLSIGLRADMDALPIVEATGLPHGRNAALIPS
jgi:hippurate hydrolase